MKYLGIIQLFVFLLYAGHLDTKSGDEKYVFQYLDNSSGLSNSAINSVFQDSDNLLWVGTWDGLNMFDGTEFKVFNYTSRDGGSIGNNVIQNVTEGSAGNIWVNTIGGITRIEKNSGAIHQYFYGTNPRRRISEKEYELAADKRGQVYVYSDNEGLKKFDSRNNSFVGVEGFSKGRIIKNLRLDEKGMLWILDGNGDLLLTKPGAAGLNILRVIRHSAGINKIFIVNKSVLLESNGQLFVNSGGLAFKKIPGNFRGIKAISLIPKGYITLSGTVGSTVDHGGYGFLMNTFDAAWPLLPLVRYEPAYANAIGKWMLNAVNASRLFYPQHIPREHQTLPDSADITKGVIAYEGIAAASTFDTLYQDLKAPVAQGDGPKWMPGKNPPVSQYSVYGSAHVGLFGATVEQTNVEGILKLDLLATDFFRKPAYPTYLCYNPYVKNKTISFKLKEKGVLYDLISQRILSAKAREIHQVNIPANGSVVLVCLPAAAKPIIRANKMLVDNIIVDYKKSKN